MPLGDGFFGTEVDQNETQEYCKFCYQDGVFVQPETTVEAMIQMSIDNMTAEQGIEESHARELANQYIPNLKRWKK
jgi:hypothetical protein